MYRAEGLRLKMEKTWKLLRYLSLQVRTLREKIAQKVQMLRAGAQFWKIGVRPIRVQVSHSLARINLRGERAHVETL